MADLTFEQFQQLRAKGLSVQQIARFDKGEIPTQQPVGLPKLQETEQLIASRKDPFQQIVETPRLPNPIFNPLGFMGGSLGLGSNILGAPISRIEAPIASAGLAAQRGELFSPQAGKEIMQGFTGQRQAQLGDIMRTIGVPEPIAALTGFAGLAGLGELATTGKLGFIGRLQGEGTGLGELGRGMQQDYSAFKGGMQTLKQNSMNLIKKPGMPKDDPILLNTTQKAVDITQKALKGVQDDIGVIRDATKNADVEMKPLAATFDKLFGKTKEDVLDFPTELRGELKTIAEEGKDFTLDKVYKFKDAIKNQIQESTWAKKGIGVSPSQQRIYDAYFDLDKIIDNSLNKTGMLQEKQLLDLANQKATQVYKLSRAVDKMTKGTAGGVIRDPAQLYTAFTGGATQAGKRAIFSTLAQIEPQMDEVIQIMNKLRATQQTKALFKRFGLGAGIGAGALGTEELVFGGIRKGLRELSNR